MEARECREQQLIDLIIVDLNLDGVRRSGLEKVRAEVRSLSDEQLDRMLHSRLDLSPTTEKGEPGRVLKSAECTE